MEVYYRHGKWVGLVFAVIAVGVLLGHLGLYEVNNRPSDTVAYGIVALIAFFALLAGTASTRMFFDNSEKACIQVRRHFWRDKRVTYPYSEIENIVVRLSRRSTNSMGGYSVGITQKATMLGQQATKYTELQYFGSEDKDHQNALLFAQKISSYSGIDFYDDSQIVRPLGR